MVRWPVDQVLLAKIQWGDQVEILQFARGVQVGHAEDDEMAINKASVVALFYELVNERVTTRQFL